MLAQTRDSHELRSLEAVPWVPGRTGSRDGETRSSQGSSPSPFPARALLGPCAAGFAGQTGTDPAGRARLWGCHQPCQGRANSSLLHPKQTQQFPGIFRRVGGSLDDSFHLQWRWRRTSLSLRPFQMSPFVPFSLPHQKFCLFLLPELLKLKGTAFEREGKERSLGNNSDPGRKGKRMGHSFGFLKARFGVGQTPKTKKRAHGSWGDTNVGILLMSSVTSTT